MFGEESDEEFQGGSVAVLVCVYGGQMSAVSIGHSHRAGLCSAGVPDMVGMKSLGTGRTRNRVGPSPRAPPS